MTRHPELNGSWLPSRRARLCLAGGIILGAFAVDAWGVFIRPTSPDTALWIDALVNRDGHWSMVRESPLEHLEFAAWVSALIAYAAVLLRSARRRAVDAGAWALLLPLLAAVAAGEESSWGQHYFGWHPTGLLDRANFQHETNVHNLDLGVLLGLEASGWVASAARRFVQLMNPGFYAVCAAVWLVLPTMRERGLGRRWPLVRCVPVPSASTRILFASAILLFVFVDKAIGDAGEIMELSIALVGMLAGIDLLEASEARRSDEQAVALRVRASVVDG